MLRKVIHRPLSAQVPEIAPPKPLSNRGPSLETGGGAVRQGASLQGQQRKAMLMKLAGLKILGSG